MKRGFFGVIGQAIDSVLGFFYELFSMLFSPKIKFSYIEEKFPLASIDDEGFTITKDGKLAVVIELGGKDYSGMAGETLGALFNGRKRFFEEFPSELTLMYHSHRVKHENEQEIGKFSVSISQRIAAKWAKNFTETYRSRHFLIIVSETQNLKDQILMFSEKKNAEGEDTKMLQLIREATADVLGKLATYNPEVLKGDDLASYWAWLINGHPVRQRCPASGSLEDILAETVLFWPEGKNYQVYQGSRERYSAWLQIKAPPTETNSQLMEDLFASRRIFSLFQTFSRPPRELAKSKVHDVQRNASAHVQDGEILESACVELSQQLTLGSISLIEHRWSMEVIADNLKELEAAVSEIRGIVGNHGIRTARETANQEAAYWSRFPSFTRHQVRVRAMTSPNAAHFASFPTVGEGFDHCAWGDSPVTLFKTWPGGSDYSFIFHLHPGKTALGNTCVVGASEVGKTTLIDFLLSMCNRFEGFRTICFDRLNGLEVSTACHDGVYIGTRDLHKLQMNPFQLPDSTENRAFWSTFIQLLTNKTEDEDKEAIGRAIQQLAALPKDKRNLSEMHIAFGTAEKDSISRALRQWLPTGSYGAFFNGEVDALNLENNRVVFDMTTLLDVPEVLIPMIYYIFHVIRQTVRGGVPHAIFMDELPKYLKSDAFVANIESMLQEIRKTNGIFICACQDLKSLLSHRAAPIFMANIATWILYPEPTARREDYCNGLKLTERELEWLKKTDPMSRLVLVKKKNGPSVVLNANLMKLDQKLNVFNSSASAVARLHKIRTLYGTAWKSHFIFGEGSNGKELNSDRAA